MVRAILANKRCIYTSLVLCVCLLGVSTRERRGKRCVSVDARSGGGYTRTREGMKGYGTDQLEATGRAVLIVWLLLAYWEKGG